jgi:hypothetical protein
LWRSASAFLLHGFTGSIGKCLGQGARSFHELSERPVEVLIPNLCSERASRLESGHSQALPLLVAQLLNHFPKVAQLCPQLLALAA